MESLRWSCGGADTLPRSLRDEPTATLTLVGLSGRGGPTRNRNSGGRPRRRCLGRIARMNGYEVAGNVRLRPEEKERPYLPQAWGHRIAPACEQFRPSAQRR